MHPLASLPSAEQQLVHAITAAADALDQVATDAVGSALARLQLAADAAGDRIASVRARLDGIVLGVVEVLDGTTTGIPEDLPAEVLVRAIVDPPMNRVADRQQLEPAIPAAIAAAPAVELPVPEQLGPAAVAAGDAIDLAQDLADYPDASPAAQNAKTGLQAANYSTPPREASVNEIGTGRQSFGGAASAWSAARARRKLAACSPLDGNGRDDCKPLSPPPKPRRRRTASPGIASDTNQQRAVAGEPGGAAEQVEGKVTK